MKLLFSIFVLFLLTFQSKAQGLDEANKLFDNYEYQRAAKLFQEYASKKKLTFISYRKLAFCYYSIGEYDLCYPMSDSIVKVKKIDPFYYYMNGMVCLGMEKFQEAKSSFEKYKVISKEYPVDILIQSCDSIPNWKSIDAKSNKLYFDNSSKADLSGERYYRGNFLFQENGKDSAGNLMNIENVDLSEVMLAKPYFVSHEKIVNEIKVDSTMKDITVSSLALFPSSNEVLISIAQPIHENLDKRALHIFKGNFDTSSFYISNVAPWEYSGFEDSSSCAHATINKKGNLIVFTKINNQTKNADLYYTELVDGKWNIPSPINQLNTDYDEIYPLFSDDSTLTFSSDGRIGYGGLDIFKTTFSASKVGEIIHLKSPVNSHRDDFNISFYETDSVMYSSNRYGGKGDDDIYVLVYKHDSITKEQIEAKKKYEQFVANWKDEKVYFNFNKYDLGNDVKKLDEIVTFLKTNTTAQIQIEGHTDITGISIYNDYLGFKRAEIIKKQFVILGVNPDQITIVSKGDKEPFVKCPTTGKCTDKIHAQNRVALITLLKK